MCSVEESNEKISEIIEQEMTQNFDDRKDIEEKALREE